jgi:hypothetical protein
MRDWYVKHLEKKGNKKSKIKLFYFILALNIFLIFSIIKSRSQVDLIAEPHLISQKLTTDIASKSPKDRLSIIENGGKLNYLIEYELFNSGENGFVKLEAELRREDTTLFISKIVEIDSKETIIQILKFPELDYKNLKREYSLRAEAVIMEDNISEN